MIASLPMYDRPETAAAHDALWAAIRDALRARGVAAPEALDRAIGLWEGWEHPALVLGQTCGLPYRSRLHGRVTLVATFDYGLEDTPPGHYRSLFVARACDPRGAPEDFASARFAYSEGGSHSGWAAPQLWAAARGFAFAPSLRTGGHRPSARAVAEGRADIAAIDAITWRGILRWEPQVAGALKVIGRTDASPGLPLIAAAGTDADRHAEAVAEGLDRIAPEARAALGIAGLVRIPAGDYLAVPTPPAPARLAG